MVKRFEIIPRQFWKNVRTGDTASIYGSHPATSANTEADWMVVTDGVVYRDNKSGTIHGNPNMRTEEAIDAYLTKFHGKDWRELEL